jgi:hypothetical protein
MGRASNHLGGVSRMWLTKNRMEETGTSQRFTHQAYKLFLALDLSPSPPSPLQWARTPPHFKGPVVQFFFSHTHE